MSFLVWLLHWLTVLAVAVTFLIWMRPALPTYFGKGVHFWHELHVSFGLLALGLVAVRLLRLFIMGPMLVHLRGPKLARIAQLVLLLLVIALAISGYIAVRQPALGMQIRLFWFWPLLELTSIGPARAWREAHTLLAYVFICAIAAPVIFGFRRRTPTQERPFVTMLWPWSSRRNWNV